MNKKYKIIPSEKCFWFKGLPTKEEYIKLEKLGITDAAICKCGFIYFSGRERYETVLVKCPNCGKVIVYG